MRLLVVDFDFFFPVPDLAAVPLDEMVCYDWGHAETGDLYRLFLWQNRATGFFRQNKPLPYTDGLWRTFWDRFQFRPKVDLFYGDSNSLAYHPRVHRNVNEVWLFDAHHDSGYHGEESLEMMMRRQAVTCEDWMCGYSMDGVDLHMRYPKWRAWAMEAEPVPPIKVDREVDDGEPIQDFAFDRIFVCQSQSWTPPWIDQDFMEFIGLAPVQRRVALDEDAGVRDFDEESALRESLAMNLAMHSGMHSEEAMSMASAFATAGALSIEEVKERLARD